MSIALYDAALESGATGVRVRHDDGTCGHLDVPRWSGRPDAADQALLDRANGPVLDVGCGPGRLVAELTRRGVPALGLDLSETAVRLTSQRGGYAVRGDVFDGVPLAGTWRQMLLADGNIGIGGSPAILLALLATGLAPDGEVLAELSPPGTRTGPVRARLEPPGVPPGRWFPWARVGVGCAEVVADAAGLRVGEVWEVEERWFARFRR